MKEIELSEMKERNIEEGDSSESFSKKLPYPKAVFFIIATELSERFSYYGMRAVLTIYMRNMLKFSEDTATTLYHTFLLLCYGLPVVWGIIADSFTGKFRTIWMVSICFAIGNIILTVSSVPTLHLPAVPLSMLGLLLMSIGTGGMKPCVAPFGGEQFILPQQQKILQQFFSVFFFAMTVGNMISTVITPIFRRDVHCFDLDSCYPLAFGVPSCIMILAVGIFLAGKPLYRITKPEGNVLLKVVKCISYALFKAKKQDQPKNNHWLDRAGDKYEKRLINDIKGLLRVLVYYLPIPMFFALFEQLGSRWTLQATRMNGVIGSYTIKPDQMQVTNAILMFIFIPFFQSVIYPLLAKVNLLKMPLQRMGVGGCLAALSFLVAGMVEKRIENSYYTLPPTTSVDLNFINTCPCPIVIEGGLILNRTVVMDNLIVSIKNATNELNVQISLSESCNLGASRIAIKKRVWKGEIRLLPGHLQSVIIYLKGDSLDVFTSPFGEDTKKSNEGNAKIRIVYTDTTLNARNTNASSVQLISGHNATKNIIANLLQNNANSNDSSIMPIATEVDPDKYSISSTFISTDQTNTSQVQDLGQFNLQTGGSYLLVLFPNSTNPINPIQTQLIILNPPNDIHMLWLVPQYILMAWAEILFVVSGMEFSFTQAPLSMKSVLQSCWHLMNAFGNVIVIISAQISHNHSQANEFFGFAGAMFIDTIIFCLLAMGYTYVTITSEEEKKLAQEDKNANRPAILDSQTDSLYD